jgi:hypothetical protein
MPDDPRPALTPEQWAERNVDTEAFYGYVDDAGIIVGETGEDMGGPVGVFVYQDHLPAVMALANAALPDGHPNKVTRADVEDLAAVISAYDWDTIHGEPLARRERAARALAKLRALLPPEDPPRA